MQHVAKPERADPRLSPTAKALAATAAALGAAAVFNTYRARKAERDHPPRGRFVEADGVRLHYIERGEGPPVVLLHGNVVTAEDWLVSGVFAPLAERHRVVAFDRPGFGFSERPRGSVWTAARQAALIRKACSLLGLGPAVFVGHSWGAMVALEMALSHPEAVSGLVVLAGYYDPTVRLDVPLVALPAVPVLGDLVRHTIAPPLGSALLPLNYKAMFAPLEVPDRFSRHFPHALVVRPSQIRAESQDAVSMVPAAVGMLDRVRRLHVPTAIMAGTEDRIVGFEAHAIRLAEAIPHADLRLVEGAGHMLHYAVPGKVAEVVEAVADRTVRPVRLAGEAAATM